MLFCIFSFIAFAQEVKEVTLTVNGQGKTKDEAKFNALRNAIENAFGAFISSNTSVINDELVKDEITSLSSGNIKKINIISEVQLPDGTYTTLINATVSLNKLNDLCKSKGVTSDFSGELFAMNIKIQKFKKENELKIISNLSSTISILFNSLFDYKIEVSKPKENSGTSGWNKGLWDIPISISATVNNNSKTIEDIFTKTIKEICVSNEEEKSIIETNQKVYPITINGKIYKLRNYDSFKEIHYIFFSVPFYALNFYINNGLEKNKFDLIRNCVFERNRSLCGYSLMTDPNMGYKKFINISSSFYDILPVNMHSLNGYISQIMNDNKNYYSVRNLRSSIDLWSAIYVSEYQTKNLVINFKDFSKLSVNIVFNNTLSLDKVQKISQYKIEPIR